MDRIADYPRILETYPREQADVPFAPGVRLKLSLVVDRERNQYLLFTIGEHAQKRVHRVDLHLTTEENKVLLLENNTDLELVEDLKAAGIPAEDIVDATQDQELVN